MTIFFELEHEQMRPSLGAERTPARARVLRGSRRGPRPGALKVRAHLGSTVLKRLGTRAWREGGAGDGAAAQGPGRRGLAIRPAGCMHAGAQREASTFDVRWALRALLGDAERADGGLGRLPQQVARRHVRARALHPRAGEDAGLGGHDGRAAQAALGHGKVSGAHVRRKARDERGQSAVFRALVQGREEARLPRIHTALVQRRVLQVGRRDAGLAHDRLHLGVRSLEPVVQREREDHVGQLGLVVALPVAAPRYDALAVATERARRAQLAEVFFLEPRAEAGAGRLRHDARLPARAVCRLLERGHALAREQEVREVVCLHLHVVAVGGGLLVARHHAGVEEEDVQPGGARARDKVGGGRADGGKRLQVAVDRLNGRRWLRLGAHRLVRRRRARARAVEHEDARRAALGGDERDLLADARRRAGDGNGYAGKSRVWDASNHAGKVLALDDGHARRGGGRAHGRGG
mmetsp:Transcript_4820/g.14914  ORF Transcript_4820/g.14914 Transcript_4820/m.14914 type:complete len:465 (+) Transcript_4820:52-1446(+)